MKQLCVVTFAVVGMLALSSTASAQVVFTEEFDAVTAGPGGAQGNSPAGWFVQNSSAPIGTLGYFQGNLTVFPQNSGTGYLGGNFNSASATPPANLSNWMVTPVISGITNGMTFSFFSRTVAAPGFPDRLEVRLNTANTGTNVGAIGDANAVGDFTNLLFTINPTLTTAGYPNVWTQFNVNVTGVGVSPLSGRFAFRYFVPDAGFGGANSDYIGIDTLSITAVPEPTSLALLGVPALALAWKRRRAKTAK